MKLRTVVRGGAVLTVAQLAWHLSNLAYNSVCGRVLGPAHYGTLAAVVALLYIVSPVLLAIQTVISRLTSELVSRGDLGAVRTLLRTAVLRLGLVTAACVAAGIALSGPAASFLKLPQSRPLVILTVALGIALFAQLQRGVFQGASRFGRFAVAAFVESAVKVVAATLILTLVWKSESGAVFAIVVSSLAGTAVGWYLLRFLPQATPLPKLEHVFRYSLATLATLTALSLLFSMDVVAAKHYLPPRMAGVYASVALLGKVAFFSTTAVTVLSFPFFSAHHEARTDARRPLAASLALIGALGLGVALVYRVAPWLVVRPVFGDAYASGERYVAWMAVAITLYSIAYQSAMYLLSQRMIRGVVALAVAVAAQLSLLYAMHAGIWTILGIQLGVLGASAAVLVVLAFTHEPALQLDPLAATAP
ncbi:MAG: oligosaccharide flippase family protein [Gaiellaceae bacterium]